MESNMKIIFRNIGVKILSQNLNTSNETSRHFLRLIN